MSKRCALDWRTGRRLRRHRSARMPRKTSRTRERRFPAVRLQTALSVVIETMQRTGLLDWAGVADRMSQAPAYRVASRSRRELLSVSPRTRPSSIQTRNGRSPLQEIVPKSANSLFIGRTLPGRIVATLLRGRFTVRDPELAGAEPMTQNQWARWRRPNSSRQARLSAILLCSP